MSIGRLVQKVNSGEAVTELRSYFFLEIFIYILCVAKIFRVSREFRGQYHLVYHNIQIASAYETFQVFVVYEKFTFIVAANFYDASYFNTIAEFMWSSQHVLYCSRARTVSSVGGSCIRLDTCRTFT
jgi:hypothetical protein